MTCKQSRSCRSARLLRRLQEEIPNSANLNPMQAQSHVNLYKLSSYPTGDDEKRTRTDEHGYAHKSKIGKSKRSLH